MKRDRLFMVLAGALALSALPHGHSRGRVAGPDVGPRPERMPNPAAVEAMQRADDKRRRKALKMAANQCTS